jgi:hypothetical protein
MVGFSVHDRKLTAGTATHMAHEDLLLDVRVAEMVFAKRREHGERCEDH